MSKKIKFLQIKKYNIKYFLFFIIIYILLNNVVMAIDYDEFEKICKNKGLMPDNRQYWECVDQQKNSKKSLEKSKKLNNLNKNSYREKIPIIDYNKNNNYNERKIKPKKIINYFR